MIKLLIHQIDELGALLTSNKSYRECRLLLSTEPTETHYRVGKRTIICVWIENFNKRYCLDREILETKNKEPKIRVNNLFWAFEQQRAAC